MKTIGLTVTLTVLGFLTALLGAHVLQSIASTYSLAFFTSLTFVQTYGLMMIVKLISFVYTKEQAQEEDGDSFNRIAKTGLKKVTFTAIFYLVVWGSATLAFHILS